MNAWGLVLLGSIAHATAFAAIGVGAYLAHAAMGAGGGFAGGGLEPLHHGRRRDCRTWTLAAVVDPGRGPDGKRAAARDVPGRHGRVHTVARR